MIHLFKTISRSFIFIGCLFCFSCLSTINSSKENIIVTELPFAANVLSKEEITELDSFNTKNHLVEYCYCSNGNKYPELSGVAWESLNTPHKVKPEFPKNKIYMVLNEKEHIRYKDSILGQKLYIINTSKFQYSFLACDSRLPIRIEAKNEIGEWAPISFSPNSPCGNSYHEVVLDTNHYIEFNVPIFSGSFKTELRYVHEDFGVRIYSNSIPAYINIEQFDKENTISYQRNNIMDVYF